MKMPLLSWSGKFSVKIKEMDNQHKKIIGLINYLYDARLANKEYEVLSKIFDELMDYTRAHFGKEEDLMQKYGFPDYLSHKSLHDNLIQSVVKLQKNYYAGNEDISTDVAILLNDWIADHILKEDKKYTPFLNPKEQPFKN